MSTIKEKAMLRQIQVFVMAERVFSKPHYADRWMSRRNRRLGGRAPFQVLKDEDGTEQVVAILADLAAASRSRAQRRETVPY
jgi:uncharacterized protein (DUF2384 family)